MDVLVLDNFLINPEKERAKALSADFKDIEHNGLKYRQIAMTEDKRNISRIEIALGVKFKETTVFYRNYLEKNQDTFIHSDVLIGSFSGILYLNPDPPKESGTAFWKHKEYGFETHEPKEGRDDAFWKQIHQDGFYESKWEMTQFVEGKFNRLLIFFSPRYHSRMPKNSFGTEIGNARLIKVFFGKI